MGVCSVSKESCQNILGLGGGSAITIVVGGAAESLSARPGTADLTLRKRYGTTERLPSFLPILTARFIRLGFIKVAIREGCVEWQCLPSSRR